MQEWVINQMNFVEILGIIYTQEKGSVRRIGSDFLFAPKDLY